MNWIMYIYEKFFGENSKFFLLGAWLTALFIVYGQFWSLIGVALACGFVYVSEKQMQGIWDTNDMCGVLLGALTTLIFALLFFP